MATVMCDCIARLASAVYHGPPTRTPTTKAIVTALEGPFNPCVFGLGLDAAMQVQKPVYPHAQVPVVLSFCADAMLALDAPWTRDIWGISLNYELVETLQHRVDCGTYTLAGLPTVPALPANLLVKYLSMLTPALLPLSILPPLGSGKHQPSAHSHINANTFTHTSLCRSLQSLPPLPRKVFLFVMSFLQLFCSPESVTATGISPARLAAHFAPVLFGSDTHIKAKNSRPDQIAFLSAALMRLDCHTVDPEYVPSHGQGPQRNVESNLSDGPTTDSHQGGTGSTPVTTGTRPDQRKASQSDTSSGLPRPRPLPLSKESRESSGPGLAPAVHIEAATSEGEAEDSTSATTPSYDGMLPGDVPDHPLGLPSLAPKRPVGASEEPCDGQQGQEQQQQQQHCASPVAVAMEPGYDYELQSAAQSARRSRLLYNGVFHGLPTLASGSSYDPSSHGEVGQNGMGPGPAALGRYPRS